MNRKRWPLRSAATVEISLGQRFHLELARHEGYRGLSQNNLRNSGNFVADASVWTVELLCETEQTVVLF
jgi:hypothetical protein